MVLSTKTSNFSRQKSGLGVERFKSLMPEFYVKYPAREPTAELIIVAAFILV
jgi:hypothetical protein